MNVPKRICGSESSKEAIKNHGWFKGLKWEALLNRTLTPPFRAENRKESNTSNFEKFTENEIVIHTKDQYEDIFADF